jgi:hypothetical protein
MMELRWANPKSVAILNHGNVGNKQHARPALKMAQYAIAIAPYELRANGHKIQKDRVTRGLFSLLKASLSAPCVKANLYMVLETII